MPSHSSPLPEFTNEAERLALALEKSRRVGNHWLACCPAHADRHPSLSIAAKNGKVLLHCWAGCSQDAVINALKERGLWGRGRV
jgi:putative DNA primase/helicase